MNNPWDAILENQKKVMDFWSGMARQMANTPAQNGNGKAAGADLMNQWMEQQKQFWEQWTKNMQPENAMSAMPEQWRQWMEMQQKFTEQYMQLYRENAAKMGLKWPDMDMSAFMPARVMEENLRNWRQWTQSGDQWLRDAMMAKMPYNMQPHYANFLRFFDDLKRYWEPFARMIQHGMTNPEMIEKYFNYDAYTKVINQLMGFKPVGNVTELIEAVNHYFEVIAQRMNEEASQWVTLSDSWRSKMNEIFAGSQAPFFQFSNDINNRLRDQLTPFFNVAAQGKQTEMVKLLRDIQFGYVSFILKTAELQTKVYEAGRFALPEVMREQYEAYQKTKELPDYNAFLHQYINKLEAHILEVLQADDYSKLQSEIAALGVTIKHKADKLAELMLSDWPLLSRSEADDIAQEVAALRKKLRTMEERLEQLEARAPANAEANDDKASRSKRVTAKS